MPRLPLMPPAANGWDLTFVAPRLHTHLGAGNSGERDGARSLTEAMAVVRRKSRFNLSTLAAVSACALGLALWASAWWYFPEEDAAAYKSGPPPRIWAHRLQAGRGRSADKFEYVPLGAVSAPLCLGVLVAEDANFFGHGAADVAAIWEALRHKRAGRPLRGASTISQQLAKNLFLSSERSLWRKVQELRMAAWLERHLGKRRIFELYVNIIELGPHLFGVQAAARHYLQRDAAQLDAAEAALLAASIPAPAVANPHTRTAAFRVRRNAVAVRMAKHAYLLHYFQ